MEKMTATISYIDHAIGLLNNARERLEKQDSFHQEHAAQLIRSAMGNLRTCEIHCNHAIDERLRRLRESEEKNAAELQAHRAKHRQ